MGEMNALPYPPPPEPGWCDDGAMTVAASPADQPSSVPMADAEQIDDWEGTVLSSSYVLRHGHKAYRLHNDVTGQDITVDSAVLLGRKPSTVPEGAKAVRLDDPTRTVSRNHVAISFDRDGAVWIEDYGSLNGTYIIRDGVETQVFARTPVRLEAPATVRIGDQFFTFEER